MGRGGLLFRRMLHVHVRHFMRHHSRKLGFVGGGVNRANIDEDRPAGRRECIDLLLLDYVKLIRPRIL
jgi:hypothetical protein